MNKYIALLRGINVGGHRKIRMEELRNSISNAGFQKVQTYIQSGNIIFSSDKPISESELESELSELIRREFGYDVAAIIRANKDIMQILDKNPFPPDQYSEKFLNLVFMNHFPDDSKLHLFNNVEFKNEQFILSGREIYFYCPEGLAKTKFTNSFFEKKLLVKSTGRNWNTAKKLAELSLN